MCGSCRSTTALFADVAEEVPSDVAALDGVETTDEAHNVERPARSSLKKKRGPKGKDLSEFEAGSTVTGSVRSITTYGAFIDIGATTDGLLHISQLSSEYVGDVNSVLKVGQEVDVRIISIDSDKGQVALSLLTQAQDDASQANQRQKRERPQRQNARRDDSKVLAQLSKMGWDAGTFVEGTVVSTVDFGCFVRVDASKLNSECEGELDGLVHISAMSSGRVNAASDVVSPDDKVQVRMLGINGNKVSLTMLSVESEESKADSNTPIGGGEGAKDWKDSLEKFDATMPVFKNGPIVVGERA
jgi:elongation factor Ts